MWLFVNRLEIYQPWGIVVYDCDDKAIFDINIVDIYDLHVDLIGDCPYQQTKVEPDWSQA